MTRTLRPSPFPVALLVSQRRADQRGKDFLREIRVDIQGFGPAARRLKHIFFAFVITRRLSGQLLALSYFADDALSFRNQFNEPLIHR